MARRCIVATGYILNGKLRLAQHGAFVDALKGMPNCKVVLRLEEHRNPRSVALNAYYWAVVVALIVEHTGYTEAEAHELMKQLHLEKSLTSLRGRGRVQDLRVFDGSTTDLSNEEEWRYLENIQRWAAETIDVVIPDPNGEVVAA